MCAAALARSRPQAALSVRARLLSLHALPCSSLEAPRFVAASADGVVRVWAPAQRRVASMLRGPRSLAAAAPSPDGCTLFAACADGALLRYDLATGAPAAPLQEACGSGGGGALRALAAAAAAPLLAAAGDGAAVRLFDLRAATAAARFTARGASHALRCS
jgi:WD40 repeat protein